MNNVDQPPKQIIKDGGVATQPDSKRIIENFSLFDHEVRLAETAYAKGEFEIAAFYASTAATIATHKHCGIFVSPRLEAMLSAIGGRIVSQKRKFRAEQNRKIKNVLHVGSELSSVGGLTRMISRWIDTDSGRVNSLVLTQHRGDIPQHLTDAVYRSGGQIVRLNRTIGSRFDWARSLRKIASSHDAVILHIHCEDVVPILALADKTGLPPVIFLNHADHLFWLGADVADLVLNLRDAATDISIHRRGIEPPRNFLLPTIVEQTVRRHTPQAAKLKLGLPPDSILLLSVARSPKYRSLNGVSFADRHVRLLEKFPTARLIVVGSGEPNDWQAAKSLVNGRIMGLPEQPNPRLYFEAADIYLDSYPFASSTSMMEAAGYGLPVVTIFPWPEQANIFGINHVGLVGTSLVATTTDEYNSLLERLVVDADFRAQKGKAAYEAMERFHAPAGWRSYLEAVFERAEKLVPRNNKQTENNSALERPQFGPADNLHEDIVGSNYSAAQIDMVYMGALPFRQRMWLWSSLRKRGEIKGATAILRLLLPEWLKRLAKP